MRVLICGDRHWTDSHLIFEYLDGYSGTIEVVIHGCSRGADSIAGSIADQLNIPVERYPAQWSMYGRGAGPIRNQKMLDEGKPDFVWAFHNDIRNSKGTKDMITRTMLAEIPFLVIGA